MKVTMNIQFVYDTDSKGEALKRFRKEMEGIDWKAKCFALNINIEVVEDEDKI